MKIFGKHDEKTLAQFKDVSSRAVDAALMADGHVGFTMPIGGVAAYDRQVSVVGVGFDIACIAAGTPVLTADGCTLPIECVAATDPVVCWDGAQVRPVSCHVGAVARGARPTRRLQLANGRVVVATADHEFRTQTGWRAAGELRVGELVACAVLEGLPYERPAPFDYAIADDASRAALAARGLAPIAPDDPRVAALVRLLGVVNGDGHLSGDGKQVSVYTTVERDAVDIASDFAAVGFPAHVYRRARGPGRRVEICIRVGSRALHALLAALGAPVGRKRWPVSPMPWLLDAPAWIRAQYLSALASAEMSTPRVFLNGTVANLALKQAGEDDHAIRFVARLLESLGFAVSVAPSGRAYGARRTYVLQLLGGEAEQVRFAEEVGFCHASQKRAAAARMASIVWQHTRTIAHREAAKAEARQRKAAGEHWRAICRDVASRFELTEGFIYHAIYGTRGRSRRLPGAAVEGRADGEVCWEPVVSIEDAGDNLVFDIVTSDPAQSFIAGGVVVHNCGNAAIRTDMTVTDLGRTPDHRRFMLERVADRIRDSISFGVGRKNAADDAPTDDPLFEADDWARLQERAGRTAGRALKDKARAQLGTVGSGNHYVDVFADEAGALWVGVHFGSRGFGHGVASGFLAMSQGKAWGERAPEAEALLSLESAIGDDYWALMELAGRYAYVGREWVARKVVEILGGHELELVHNHHNFAWRETHDGREVVVVRKGATPAFPGQKGFIGGSMGDDAVIVRGTVGAPAPVAELQKAALQSTVHGAGRVMSRTEAAGKKKGWGAKARIVKPGKVTPEMLREWVDAKGVILRGGGLDESPHAYRRLPEVLAAQEGTIEVLHTLQPLVVVMAGADEFDPYKD